MDIRVIGLRPRNRAAAIALGVGVVGIVAVVLVMAFTLLLALAAVGAVLGIGALLYRRVFGRGTRRAPAMHQPAFQLDPRLEVHAQDAPAHRRVPPVTIE